MRKLAKNIIILLTTCLFALNLPAETHYPLKVGFILVTLGDIGEYGEAQRNGINLALEHDSSISNNIEIHIEEAQNSARDAITAFNKLRQIDKVDLIFVWGVVNTLAVSPLAEKYQIPTIASAIVDEASRNRKYVFRTINYAGQYSKKMIDFLAKKKLNNLAIVTTEHSYQQTLINGLKANLNKDQVLKEVATVLPTDNDFRAIIARLKKTPHDALGLYLMPIPTISFAKQANVMNYHPQIFSAQVIQSQKVIDDCHGYLDGAYFTHNQVSKKFKHDYYQQFGNDIQIAWAANAYDFIMIANQIFQGFSKKPTPEEILERINHIPAGEGAGGKYQIGDLDGSKFLDYEVKAYQIQDSEVIQQ